MTSLDRYAVVSCHVEQPLDDEVWRAFERLLGRRPAGFAITAFVRPPDPSSGEDETRWLERARRAAELAPLGHHTHWGGPTQARPSGGADAAGRVRGEAEWLRSNGLAPRYFCGGGWYLDAPVAETLAGFGYVDCTATTFRQRYLAADAARLQLDGPRTLRLPSGALLSELPATHSLGMLARVAGRSPMDLFDRLLGAPLGIGRYDWVLDPAGHPFGGGSVSFLPRDFLKFGQLVLNRGMWQGHRLLDAKYVAEATSPSVTIGGRPYGYLWWGADYEVNGQAVHGAAALGAGGQILVVVPSLSLAIESYGANYASAGWSWVQNELIPHVLLPAVREAGGEQRP